jgi:GDP-4-dehydro-6-deoxy-D-mannose reductase
VKRVLITGAEGFCGRHLCEYLASHGYTVAGTYHKKRRATHNHPLYPLDITDAAQVRQVIKKFQPHYVCHLAAQSNARLSWEKPELTFRLNVFGTLNLAKAILQYAPKARLLFTSSVQVYGRFLRTGTPIKEDHPLWPENPYAVSKTLSELGLLDLSRQYGLDVMIVRANNLFGPGQTSEFVFGDWCRQIAEAEAAGKPSKIKVGNLKLKRDFLPVEDGVAAYASLLKKGKK